MFTNENMNTNNCFLQNKDSGIIKRNSKVLIFPPPHFLIPTPLYAVILQGDLILCLCYIQRNTLSMFSL